MENLDSCQLGWDGKMQGKGSHWENTGEEYCRVLTLTYEALGIFSENLRRGEKSGLM